MNCYFQKGLYFAEISKIQAVKPIGNLSVHAVQCKCPNLRHDLYFF